MIVSGPQLSEAKLYLIQRRRRSEQQFVEWDGFKPARNPPFENRHGGRIEKARSIDRRIERAFVF
ncbi:MAG: hypothetical protein ACI92S_000464 [Planctomycetaceae bacterium]|jgi:hypothetical protein